MTRSFARQSYHPSTRRLSLSLSLSLSSLARSSLASRTFRTNLARARDRIISRRNFTMAIHTRARSVRHRQSLIPRASLVRSLIPRPSNRSPTSRHPTLARVPRTSRDAVRVHVPRRQRLDRLHHPLTVLIVHHPVVDPPRRRRSSARRRRRRDATRCVVDRTRSIDVARCRSDAIDPIERRSMSIQTRSIGLDQTSSDSIQTRSIGLDRTRSDSIDVDPDSIGLDRPRSDSIRQWWSSMSRDPRIPARGFPGAREWVRKPTHVVARARAVVPSSERDARGRDRQSDGVGASVRSCVRDRTSSASTVTRTKGKGTNEAVTEGIITSR